MKFQYNLKSSGPGHGKRRILFIANCLLLSGNVGNKADSKWKGPVIIIGRFGRKCDLVYYRCKSIEVALNYLRSENKIPDVLDRDGALILHLTRRQPRASFIVDSETLGFLAGIRNVILQKNITTWANTDTRLAENVFFNGKIIRRIAISELRGVGFS